MEFSVVYYTFLVCAVIQSIYYIVFSCFLYRSKNRPSSTINVPISIVICAKNEAENLKEFLPFIIEQDYPNFEIVLINDASSDTTLEVMETFQKKRHNIKIVDVEGIEAFWGNKKYALTLGIKAAKNNILLFIDADCKPVSKNWISEIISNFSTKKTIVLGYGKYKKENTFINLLIRYETLLTAIQYFSYAKIGQPYMAVGRNLAYHKNEFFNVNGFIKHMHLKSGDDDLFIQDAANKENTAIAFSKNSFTVSLAVNNFKSWFQQKRRHISTSHYYQFKHQFFLGFFFITKLFFYGTAIISFFLFSWKIILPILLVFYFTQILIVGLAAKKLQEPQIVYFIPLLEISLLLFQFSIFIANLISKPTHWK